RAVFDRTDGVPFFVNELGSALAASGRLEAGPYGLELLEGEDVPLPDSVRDAVLLRAARLFGDARVAALAVAGLPEWPDELLRQGIVAEAAPGRMAFRHALVRDAFYGEVPWTRRVALHRAVAERLGGPLPPRGGGAGTGALAGGPSRPGRRCWWRPRRSVPCTPTGTPSGPPAGPWSCGRRSATRDPAAHAQTCSSAWPAAPSWA